MPPLTGPSSCSGIALWHRDEPILQLLAANPRPEMVELPVGAPDLNPQEQAWKQTRRAVGHNHLTSKLPELSDRFDSSFLDYHRCYLVYPFLNYWLKMFLT